MSIENAMKELDGEDPGYLYNNYPLIKSVVDHFSGKIMEELFDYFGVGSHLPFDSVASKFHDDKISMGSILGKIKQLIKEASLDETQVPDRKSDDEIIGNVMKNVREREDKATSKTIIDTVSSSYETIDRSLGGDKVIQNPKDRLDLEGDIDIPHERNQFSVNLEEQLPELTSDEIAYIIDVSNKISQLIDEPQKERFLRRYFKFLTVEHKDVLVNFGGNKRSMIASIGYMTVKSVVGPANVPLRTKKSFFNHVGSSSDSTVRSVNRLKQYFS